jgi:glycosyltransferase involved in cell wall biosynthesis
MHVGLMGRSVRPGATGIGRHTANLIRELGKLLPKGKLTVFLTQDAPRLWNDDVQEVRAPWPTPNEYARAFWEQTVVPQQVMNLGVDIYHSPNYILPLRDMHCPSIVTVHDLSFRRRALHRLKSHLYLSIMTGLALRRAQAVVAVSEYTKRMIETNYPRVLGRVEAIYGGITPTLSKPTAEEVRDFRQRESLETPYVLFVGTLEPRKNLVRLVHAFEKAIQRTDLPHQLILLGPRGWKTRSLDLAIANSPYRSRIRCPGYVSDNDLSCWYVSADLFIYPSIEEGFGLPVLEAMSLGVPVITSNRSSLPELAGNAALTIDPFDLEALSEAIIEMLTDMSLAENLRAVGKQRAKQFSWEKTARKHLWLYERVFSGS